MAFITLQGTLLDPNGSVSIGDELRFTQKSTTGSTLKSAVTLLKLTTLGNYYIDLQYGLVLVEYKDVKNNQFENLGVVTVNQDSAATTLPELLNAIVPPTDAQLLEFQAILADCVTQVTLATTQAVRSETAASISEAFANQLTTTELIASTATFAVDVVLLTSGFTVSGSGSGSWKQTGLTGQTPSQSPAQLGDALLNDGNGNQWALVGTRFNAFTLGYTLLADFYPIFLAAHTHSVSSGATFVFENIDHLISAPLTMSAGFKVETMTDAKVKPFGAYVGDGMILDNTFDSSATLPRATDFTSGSGVVLFGSNLADIKINRIARCMNAVKLKTVNSGLDAKVLDARVDVMFIATCTNGVVFESDNALNVMQGNEIYVNFMTQTSTGVLFEDNGTHTGAANWDSNVVQLQAFDPIGLTVQRLLANDSAFGVPRLTFRVESWVGGFDGPAPKIIDGAFDGSTFTLSMAEPILRGWINLPGRQNTFISRNKMDILNTPVNALNTSNPATFNGGVHLERGVSLLRLTTIADVAAGQTATFYAYHVFLGGAGVTSRGKADSYINLEIAQVKPYVPLMSGVSNSINVENEIIIRWTNTTNATILSGETIDLLIEVK